MAEDILGDSEAFIRSRRHVWQGRVHITEAAHAYKLAIEAQAINYQTWQDVIRWRLDDENFSRSQWLELTQQIAKAMAKYPVPMFELVEMYEKQKLFTSDSPAEKIKIWQALYVAAGDNFRSYWMEFTNILKRQQEELGSSSEAKVALATMLFGTYRNSDKYLSDLLGWGQKELGNNAKTEKQWLVLIQGTSLHSYIKTSEPTYLWSFLFSLMTFVIVIVGILQVTVGELLSEDQNPFPYILKLIVAGSLSMSLSCLFGKKLLAFITCLASSAFSLFLLGYV